MGEVLKSPLTEQDSEISSFVNPDCFLFDEGALIGRWALTEYVRDGGFRHGGSYKTESLRLDQDQTNQLFSYCRSLVWESKHFGLKPIIFVTEVGAKQIEEDGRAGWGDAFRVVSPELVWHDLQRITFEVKANRTLANLIKLEGIPGMGLPMNVDISDYPGTMGAITPDTHYVLGPCFAAGDSEALMILQWLQSEDLIQNRKRGSNYEIFLKPKAYIMADSPRFGYGSGVPTTFLICRFIDELDHVYDNVYSKLEHRADVKCVIRRVKDIEHIDRIDDRIMLEIERSATILVDLTEALTNFNVAMEAGYALALGKPIVWAKKDDGKELRLPFDIQSQNLLLWKRDDEDYGDFEDRLAARMRVALDTATGRRS